MSSSLWTKNQLIATPQPLFLNDHVAIEQKALQHTIVVGVMLAPGQGIPQGSCRDCLRSAVHKYNETEATQAQTINRSMLSTAEWLHGILPDMPRWILRILLRKIGTDQIHNPGAFMFVFGEKFALLVLLNGASMPSTEEELFMNSQRVTVTVSVATLDSATMEPENSIDDLGWIRPDDCLWEHVNEAVQSKNGDARSVRLYVQPHDQDMMPLRSKRGGHLYKGCNLRIMCLKVSETEPLDISTTDNMGSFPISELAPAASTGGTAATACEQATERIDLDSSKTLSPPMVTTTKPVLDESELDSLSTERPISESKPKAFIRKNVKRAADFASAGKLSKKQANADLTSNLSTSNKTECKTATEGRGKEKIVPNEEKYQNKLASPPTQPVEVHESRNAKRVGNSSSSRQKKATNRPARPVNAERHNANQEHIANSEVPKNEICSVHQDNDQDHSSDASDATMVYLDFSPREYISLERAFRNKPLAPRERTWDYSEYVPSDEKEAKKIINAAQREISEMKRGKEDLAPTSGSKRRGRPKGSKNKPKQSSAALVAGTISVEGNAASSGVDTTGGSDDQARKKRVKGPDITAGFNHPARSSSSATSPGRLRVKQVGHHQNDEDSLDGTDSPKKFARRDIGRSKASPAVAYKYTYTDDDLDV